jgi:hypothetical protein
VNSRFLAAFSCALLLGCSSSSSTSSSPPAPDLGNGVAPTEPALPAPPAGIPSATCTIDLTAGTIWNDGTHPDETTDGINAAIQTLVAGGCGHVKLPAGTYAIGKALSKDATAGIELQSNMSFELDPAAVLQLRPTSTWAYCIVDVSRKHDVRISGGAIVGDRDVHDFTVQGEEGHCICVEDESQRVAIDGTKLSKAIGDGVLIVAQGADGSSCTDVSITNSELFDNRRQGVSIVGGLRVLIEKNHIHDIHGTDPQFGIDIESLSYKSGDVTVRNNQFDHNAGGDFVNTDGRSVLVENNTMTDGDGNTYTDGPIIYWSNTDEIVRGNQITMQRGSANGKMGILEYSHKAPRTNPTRVVIEKNQLTDCSIDLMEDSLVTVRGNTVNGADAAYILYQMTGVELTDNTLVKNGLSYSYMIYQCSGTASGNVLNGTPYDIPMTPDAPYSNWDGN